VYSERGRAVVRITGSMEQLETFFEFVNKYFIGARNSGDRLGIDFCHEEYGMMEMRGYKLSVVTDSLCGGRQAAFDVTLSYPGGVTIEEIMKRIGGKAGEEGLKAELIQNFDPVVFPKDTPMVKAMQESYELVTGLDGTPVTTTGGTYAKAMPGIVPFGPSFPGQKGISHNPNEWMSVEDLMTNAKIYALALYRLGQL
jgi:succinyl-diaminopimelate desuccinylase